MKKIAVLFVLCMALNARAEVITPGQDGVPRWAQRWIVDVQVHGIRQYLHDGWLRPLQLYMLLRYGGPSVIALLPPKPDPMPRR